MPDISSFSPLWGVWTIGKPLGSGTFGEVFEARRTDTGREYFAAIKHITIPPKGTTMQTLRADGFVTDEASAQRYCKSLLDTLTREIDICYELKGHTNFVSYEDHMIIPRQGEIGYDIFIRMELLTSLPDYASENGMTVADITKLCEDMCTALSVLEQKRIIHRDIKPANIFVSPAGDFKLGDFGVARHMEGLGSMSVKGTYNYMAPEILRGGTVGSNSDLYSLGLVLYRLLNYSRAPFLPPPPAQIDHEVDQSALDRRLSGAPLPAPARAELSLPLTNVIMRACEYDPPRRFQTANEMKNALRSFGEVQAVPSSGAKIDPDATVAAGSGELRGSQSGTGGSFTGRRQVGHDSSFGGASSRKGFSGSEAHSPRERTSNRPLFAVLFSVIGVVVVMLMVVIFLLLPKRDEGSASGGNVTITAPVTETAETAAPSPTVTPSPSPSAAIFTTPTDIRRSTLSLSDQTTPADQRVGDKFVVRGTVSSADRILSVTVTVYNSGSEPETTHTAYPDATSYDLRDLDKYILFDYLSAGQKTYEIKAVDEVGEKVLHTSAFTVAGSVGSTLGISGVSTPPDQSVGDIFGVRGVVTSNYNIYSVTVTVYDSGGTAETTETAYPGATSYDLRNIDKYIYFDALTTGMKTYQIMATDDVTTLILYSSTFRVS